MDFVFLNSVKILIVFYNDIYFATYFKTPARKKNFLKFISELFLEGAIGLGKEPNKLFPE